MAAKVTTRTVIEGGLIKTIEEKVLHTAPLEAALANIVTRSPAVVSNVPQGTKHFAVYPTPNGTEASIVIEEQPTVRVINYAGRNDRAERGDPFRINLPYVYFLMKVTTTDKTGLSGWNVDSWRVFMAPHPVNSVGEKILPIALPNTYPDGRTCTGYVDYNTQDKTLGGVVRTIVNQYWNSTFNDHLTNNWPDKIEKIEDWVQQAAGDAMSWTQWTETWKKQATLGHSMTEMFGTRFKFDDPMIIDGMIPQVKMPFTYDKFDEWLQSLPKEVVAKITGELIGAHTTRISAII